MALKHLDPQQLPETPFQPAKKGKKISSIAWILIAGIVVGGFGGLGSWFWPVQRSDHVTTQQRDSRQAAFAQVTALSLPTVAASAMDGALDSMHLTPIERSKLRAVLGGDSNSPTSDRGGSPGSPALATAPLQHSAVRLVSVTLRDTHDEDGDVVTVSSAGYQRQIVLTNAPQTVVFPVDQASVVQFSGVHDGGGGITLGIRGPNQEILLPIMSEGQTLTLPVTN